LNRLPFTSKPSGNKWKNITPEILFHDNCKKDIIELGLFLEKMSKIRSKKAIFLRGNNINRFSRSFEVGDIVKFNRDKNSCVIGRVISKNGSRYEVAGRDTNRIYFIHPSELQEIKAPSNMIDNIM